MDMELEEVVHDATNPDQAPLVNLIEILASPLQLSFQFAADLSTSTNYKLVVILSVYSACLICAFSVGYVGFLILRKFFFRPFLYKYAYGKKKQHRN